MNSYKAHNKNSSVSKYSVARMGVKPKSAGLQHPQFQLRTATV